MKRFIFAVVFVFAISGVSLSQQVLAHPALVYSLPRTELCFELEIERVVEKPGVFVQYSQRYLATNQVVLEEKESYRLIGVRVIPRAVPDPARRFFIQPSSKSALQHIVVDHQGILSGINVRPVHRPIAAKHDPATYTRQSDSRFQGVLPLTQEYMMAGSVARLAEGAAKQIYDIRESRINLLTGELDHMPSDGDALKMMLQGLDRQEKELTELFIGSVSTTRTKHQLWFMPDSDQLETVLFRISEKRGLVDSDDLGGAPYFLNFMPEIVQVPTQADARLKPVPVGLYTVLPALTNIKVTDGMNILLDQQMYMPQFGVLIPHAESLFQSLKLKMTVDTHTGRLLSFQIP